MTMELATGDVWIWTGHMWDDRVRLVLDQYGDRITDVSLFSWSVNVNGDLRQTFAPENLDPYRAKWPHIRFWGAFRNMDDPDDGPRTIFDALRDSPAARERLADQVQSQMFTAYPYLHGVDIDMESGGDSRSEDSEAIFRAVADRAHSLGREAGGAIPPLTIDGSVGSENWVRYRELGQILDSVEVMSYDFAWGGSAPGPISPGFWMEDVYNWVSSQVAPHKIKMGIPLYARFWRLHDTPPNLGHTWRGTSGTYYYFWQQFTGATPWYGDGSQPQAGWIAYREPSSQSMWGLLHAYDWLEPYMMDDSTGINTGVWSGKNYSVRYGEPSATSLWSIVDNAAGSTYSDYTLVPEQITDINSELNAPYRGFTVTLEMLTREPIAAMIIDDYATSTQQLDNIYDFAEGAWEYVVPYGAYSQFRGSGDLTYSHTFAADRALYVQGRGQFASTGTFSLRCQGFEAELDHNGTIRLLRDGVEIASGTGFSPGTGGSAGTDLFVIGLRVRENSARVYMSDSEEGLIPTQIEVTDTSLPASADGTVGFSSTAEMWLDHTVLGDGWWYQPRESVSVSVNGAAPVEMGRLIRNGIEWDHTINAFRPLTDVDERDTRAEQWTEYSILDWGYTHYVDAPFQAGETHNVRIVHSDHDVWLGRIILFDRDGGIMTYCNDAQSVLHWRARARHDWQLGGVAMWSLGQEDVRMWDYFAGGEFPPETKVLDG